jgi:hypothetical protein
MRHFANIAQWLLLVCLLQWQLWSCCNPWAIPFPYKNITVVAATCACRCRLTDTLHVTSKLASTLTRPKLRFLNSVGPPG